MSAPARTAGAYLPFRGAIQVVRNEAGRTFEIAFRLTNRTLRKLRGFAAALICERRLVGARLPEARRRYFQNGTICCSVLYRDNPLSEAEQNLWKPTVFIVEDERLTALAIEMGLEQLGYNIFGVASDVDAAIEATRCHDYNVAVLDLDLNGRRVDPVAHALSRRQIPFIVASAYQISDDMPEVVRSAPRVGKPYGVEHLQRAIAAARRPG